MVIIIVAFKNVLYKGFSLSNSLDVIIKQEWGTALFIKRTRGMTR